MYNPSNKELILDALMRTVGLTYSGDYYDILASKPMTYADACKINTSALTKVKQYEDMKNEVTGLWRNIVHKSSFKEKGR